MFLLSISKFRQRIARVAGLLVLAVVMPLAAQTNPDQSVYTDSLPNGWHNLASWSSTIGFEQQRHLRSFGNPRRSASPSRTTRAGHIYSGTPELRLQRLSPISPSGFNGGASGGQQLQRCYAELIMVCGQPAGKPINLPTLTTDMAANHHFVGQPWAWPTNPNFSGICHPKTGLGSRHSPRSPAWTTSRSIGAVPPPPPPPVTSHTGGHHRRCVS